MFENLRRAFREAVDNFHREMDRDRVGETVDGLLERMVREAARTLATLKGLEKQLAVARKRIEAESRERDVCRRRESMATKIGDEETARVAAAYAEKHEARVAVLVRKASALDAEIGLLRSEVREMEAQIRKARASREDLVARSGRAAAADSLGGADDLFGELDRMAERIEGDADAADLGKGLFDDGRAFDDALTASRRERDAAARLDELKRRMGRT